MNDDDANNSGKIMHVVRIRDDGDDNDSNNIEKHKKREQYEQLLMGIRNLPPLNIQEVYAQLLETLSNTSLSNTRESRTISRF